jgi:hypothetical protein
LTSEHELKNGPVMGAAVSQLKKQGLESLREWLIVSKQEKELLRVVCRL